MSELITPITFETGDLSQALGNLQQSYGTLSVGAYAKNGSYGCRVIANDDEQVGNSAAYIYQSFTNPTGNIVWAKMWIRHVSYTRAGYSTANGKSVLAICDASGTRMAWITIQNTIGSRLTLRAALRSKSGTDSFVGNSVELPDSNYHSVTLKIDRSGAQPVVLWRLDGSQQASSTDSSSGTDGLALTPGFAIFGEIHVYQWEPAVYTFDIDDCGVYDLDPDASSARLTRLALLGCG